MLGRQKLEPRVQWVVEGLQMDDASNLNICYRGSGQGFSFLAIGIALNSGDMQPVRMLDMFRWLMTKAGFQACNS